MRIFAFLPEEFLAFLHRHCDGLLAIRNRLGHCIWEIFSPLLKAFAITTLDGGRSAPAFRAARPTHVSFEAEMSQNVIAAQKVRGRASPLGSVEPPRGRPTLREIFEATPDCASYKRGMRLLGRARARLPPRPRADLPARSDTQAIQAAKGFVHFRGSSLVRLPRPRCARLGNKTPSWEQRAHGSSPAAAHGSRPRLAKRLLLSCFARHAIETIALRLTRRPLPPRAGHRDVHGHPLGFRRGRHHAPGQGPRQLELGQEPQRGLLKPRRWNERARARTSCKYVILNVFNRALLKQRAPTLRADDVPTHGLRPFVRRGSRPRPLRAPHLRVRERRPRLAHRRRRDDGARRQNRVAS